MAKKKHLFCWTKFWANECLSATVEQAAKAHIILTFTSIKPFNRAVAGLFTSTGTNRTCSVLTKTASTKTLDLTMNSAYALNNPITLVFNPTLKGATVTKTVTNNISS
jgi:hypothetical protein